MRSFIKRHLSYLIVLLVVIGGILLYLFQQDEFLYQTLFHFKESLEKGEEIRQKILAYGSLAPLIFVGLQVLQVILAPIPGEASGALGGYLFGAWPSFIYSSIGLTLGSWIAFAIGRLLDDLITDRLHQTKIYQKFNHLVCRGDFVVPFILFLLPGFPKDSLSYLLGLSTMPMPVFLVIAAVGRMPGTLMLSFQGAEIYEGNYLRLAILLLLSACVALPCYIFRKRIHAWLHHYNNRSKNNADNHGE